MEIVEVRIETAQPAELRRFYAESLGLPVSAADDEAGDGFTVSVGGSTLVVVAAGSGESPVYHLAFTVPSDALPGGKAWVAERTPLLTDPDGRSEFRFDDWRASSVYVADPAGSILELIAWDAAADASVAPVDVPRPFGPADLLAVGEVGLVVPDVAGTVARLGEAGFTPYSADWSPEFAPVGDPTGRLIVVPVGRPWFPVGLPAVAAPLAVTLRGAHDATFTLPGSRVEITITP